MKKVKSIAAMFSLAFLFFYSCATKPEVTPTTTTSLEASVPKVAPEGSWQKEWSSLLEAARKEGSFILYCSANGRFKEYIGNAVKEKLGIQMEFFSMRGALISQKIQAERRAGIYNADVYVGGATTVATMFKPQGILDPLEPAIFLPEALDPKAWWGGGFRWLNKEHSNLALLSYANRPIVINTTIVNPNEIKSFRDLLNPKWKGKMILDDPTKTGPGEKLVKITGEYIMGWDYIRELAKQEPVILADYRQEVEWLAQGKYPILLGSNPSTVETFREAGAPLAYLTLSEGTYLTSGMGTLSLINKAPHPKAARAFINWMLTKEGQTILAKAELLPASRLDAIVKEIDPASLLQPGVKYVESDHEEVSFKIAELDKIIHEIFTLR